MSLLREVSCNVVTETVRGLFVEANQSLGEDVLEAIERACRAEESGLGRHALEQMAENARIAQERAEPLCQDTGLAVVFVEIGQDVHIVGGDFNEAVQEGVRRAYAEESFRKSLCDPLTRRNTGDNTPAVIHAEIVAGDRIRIRVMAKGGGSENASTVRMLLPTSAEEGIKKMVVECVEKAGPNPCPPTIIGVGIGGTIERSLLLAKKALLRPLGDRNGDPRLAKLEGDILAEVNALGIGPQGYGGKTTSLDVHIEMQPCHIASLPVAVNIQCHSARHKEAVI